MSVTARIRRLIVALVIVCAAVGVVGQQVSAHTPKRDARADAKVQAKLFADYYKATTPAQNLDRTIERLRHSEAGAAAMQGCEEYMCLWFYDPSTYTCVNQGVLFCDAGFCGVCTCDQGGGGCYFEG